MFTIRALSLALIILVCLCVGTATAADPDFRVNQEMYPGVFPQYGTSIAHDAAGNFATTWVDLRSGEPMGYFQIFNADGTPRGDNILFDQNRLYWWGNWKDVPPGIGMDAAGNIAIAAATRNPDMDQHVAIWCFDPDGNPVAGPIQVSTSESAGSGLKPWEIELAMNAQGHGVVMWLEDEYDIIWGQYIDVDGNLIGDNFMVSDSSLDMPYYPLRTIMGEDGAVIATSKNRVFIDTSWISQAVVWTAAYGNPTQEKIVFDQEALFHPDTLYDIDDVPRIAYHHATGRVAISWSKSIKEIIPGGYALWGYEYVCGIRNPDGSMLADSIFLVDRQESMDKEGFWSDIAATPDGFIFGLWNRADSILEIQPIGADGSTTGAPYTVAPGPFSHNIRGFEMLNTAADDMTLIWQAEPSDLRPDVMVQGFTSSGAHLFDARRVHDDIGSIQTRPQIVLNGAGVSLVLWIDDRHTIRQTIYGRVLNANKEPLGDDFIVSQQDGFWLRDLRVAANANGDAVAVWTAWKNDSYIPEAVYAQRFGGGTFSPVGNNFQVSDPAYASSDFRADVAVFDDGSFAIAYRGTTVDTWSARPYNLYLQFFDSYANPVAGLVRVNTIDYPDVGDSQTSLIPNLAIDGTGKLGVAWTSTGGNVMLQKYQYPAMPIGSNTTVGNLASSHGDMAIAGDDVGRWFVAWDGSSGSYGGIWVGAVDASNTPLFAPFRVATEYHYEATLDGAIGPDGAFAVVYDMPMEGDYDWTFEQYDVFMRRVSATGQLVGNLFRLCSDETGGDQHRPSMSISGSTLAAVWEDERNSIGNFDVYARVIDYADATMQPGDFDLSGSVNISDLTMFVDYLFSGGMAPIDPSVCDFDGNGTINISDLTALVNYLF